MAGKCVEGLADSKYVCTASKTVYRNLNFKTVVVPAAQATPSPWGFSSGTATVLFLSD